MERVGGWGVERMIPSWFTPRCTYRSVILTFFGRCNYKFVQWSWVCWCCSVMYKNWKRAYIHCRRRGEEWLCVSVCVTKMFREDLGLSKHNGPMLNFDVISLTELYLFRLQTAGCANWAPTSVRGNMLAWQSHRSTGTKYKMNLGWIPLSYLRVCACCSVA